MEIILNELRVQMESLKLDDMKLDVKINKLSDRIADIEKKQQTLANLIWENFHAK
jgi:predicted  nucleic acid-binding Zn-ribbon protein